MQPPLKPCFIISAQYDMETNNQNKLGNFHVPKIRSFEWIDFEKHFDSKTCFFFSYFTLTYYVTIKATMYVYL